jgi:hypothetical protein
MTTFLALARIVVALAVFAAVAVQFHVATGVAGFDPVNFFSYFTNVCNIAGAVVLLAAAFGLPAGARPRDILRGAATLGLAIVGIVFAVLLANEEASLKPWVNLVVHQAMPVAMVADWCADPPRTRLALADAAWWLVLPAVYVAYTLVRGGIVHWYPYPFLNVDRIGYPVVSGYVAAIAVVSVLLAGVLLVAGTALRARRAAA